MKPGVKKGLVSCFIYPVSILSAFGARVLSLSVLAALFRFWNLTEKTLPYAPLWAQRLTQVSGLIADVFFLAFLILPLYAYAGKKGKTRKKDLLYIPAGMLVSVITVGAFLVLGSARMPKTRVFPFAGAFCLYALMDFLSVTAAAYVARKTPGKTFCAKAPVRLALSVILQAAYWILSKGSLSVVMILNACLVGLLLHLLYEKENSLLPEILLLSAFRFFTRFVLGYPDLGGVYPVSEPVLTGAMNGVSHSILTTVYLLAVCAWIFAHWLRIQKGDRHVSA